jgi:hypothetical protein
VPLSRTSPLHQKLGSSRTAAIALSAIHGLAVVAVAVSQIGWVFKLPLFSLMAISYVYGWKSCASRSGKKTIVALTLREEGKVELDYGNGHRVETDVDLSSTVLHWIVVLRLQQGRKHFFLLLLPDMFEPECWRRLSVRLRALAPKN